MVFNVSANFISLKITFALITLVFGQILSRIIGQILRGNFSVSKNWTCNARKNRLALCG